MLLRVDLAEVRMHLVMFQSIFILLVSEALISVGDYRAVKPNIL